MALHFEQNQPGAQSELVAQVGAASPVTTSSSRPPPSVIGGSAMGSVAQPAPGQSTANAATPSARIIG
jgi:hypothetical protein